MQEIEQGLLTPIYATDKYDIQVRSTIRTWLEKHGNFDCQYTIQQGMPKTLEQYILELGQLKSNCWKSKKIEQIKKLFFLTS